MKEQTISKTSAAVRIASVYGPLEKWHIETAEGEGYGISSCRFWGAVLTGLFNMLVLSVIAIFFGTCIVDFGIWIYFLFTVGAIAPGGAAVVVLILLFVAIAVTIAATLNWATGKAVETVPGAKVAKAMKESIIDKICVPVHFR